MNAPKRFLNNKDRDELLKLIKSKLSIKQNLADVNKLLFIDDNGDIAVLTLSDGLEIQNGDSRTLTISDEGIKSAVRDYLENNPVEGGITFELGNTLEMTQDGKLNVKTTNIAEEDNPLPITSSGVNMIVGNIGAILDTI